MKRNKIADTKLVQYAASAITFLAIQDANANVVYTDLDPDTVLGGEGAEVSFDVNSDGTDDLFFQVYNYAGTGTYYGFNFTFSVNVAGGSALNGNELMGTIVSYSGYSAVSAPVLGPGEGINGDDPFATGFASMGVSVAVSLSGIPYYNYQGGNWLGQDMKFMGFRINVDKDHYYGWARVSVSADAKQLTIYDYAYQDTPNESIFTGQTATAIEENPLTDTKIYGYGNQIHIDIPSEVAQGSRAQVFDMNGKLIINRDNLSGNVVIDAANVAAGNYMVMVSNQNLSIKKQVNLGF